MKVNHTEKKLTRFKSVFSLYENNATLSSLFFIFVLSGVILRAFQYFYNRSLWLDEAMLSLNIIDRSFLELLKPLDYSQGAPVGFLFLEKLSTLLLGNNELALRFFPFVFSLASVMMFWLLAIKLLEKKEAVLALAFFALNQFLIYYSSEVKQYSGDVFFVIFLYLLFVPRIKTDPTKTETIAAAVIGALAIWFSHPSVFVLAGFGITKAIYDFVNKRWLNIKKLALIGTVWLSSGLLLYYISLRNLAAEQSLLRFWKNYFAPVDILKVSTWKWYLNRSIEIMGNPIGLTFGQRLALVILVVGVAALFYKDRIKTITILAPFVFLVIASNLRLYPLGERLILFAVPILLLFLSHGMFYIIDKKSTIAKSAGIITAAILISTTAYSAMNITFNAGREEIEPAIKFIKDNIQEGDIVCIPSISYPAFKFYQKTRTEYKYLQKITCRSPRKSEEESLKCLEQLSGYKNVWLLLSHYDKYERGFFIEHLGDIGIKIDQFIGNGVEIHKFRVRTH